MQRLKFLISFRVLIGIMLLVKPLYGQSPDELRDALKEWVQVKKLISEESTDWKVEQAVIEDMIKVLAQEETDLEEKIEANEEFLSSADEKRTKLEDDREELLTASEQLQAKLVELESAIQEIYARFPSPLQKTLEPLITRVPKADQEKKPSLSVRLQSVVGILSQADKFNSGITIETELREGSSGTVEVKTLYFGLGGAIYNEVSGDSAGIGIPGDDGWEWKAIDGEKDSIASAIKVYEGVQEAAFTPIPVEIK